MFHKNVEKLLKQFRCVLRSKLNALRSVASGDLMATDEYAVQSGEEVGSFNRIQMGGVVVELPRICPPPRQIF